MRVLVVDDDPISRMVAEATVQSLGHECVSTADGDSAWQLVQDFAPDVVVSDRSMPGLDGLELCRRIRAMGSLSYTYIVMLTSFSDPADVLEGMQAGADDYVVKPLDPFVLETRMLAAHRVTRLHAELARTRAELTKQANTDPLTGLRNRLALSSDLEHLQALSVRYQRTYSLALCDVDYFKRYNDSYGHPAGDVVLQTIASALKAGVREVDRIYRYGGEEFLVVLPEQPSAQAQVVLERVLGIVRQLDVAHRAGGPSGIVTLSAGLATFTPASLHGATSLLAEADRALYEAKTTGRDRVVVGRSLTDLHSA